MITKDKSIERVLAAFKARPKGSEFGTISNRELIGVRPSGELEEAGCDLLAGNRRDEINETLEEEHGVGLVPHDYRGIFRVVPIDARGAHLLLIRLYRLQKLIAEQKNGSPSVLSITVESYNSNPFSSEEFRKVLARAAKTAKALELIAAETIQPNIDRLEKILLPFKSNDDEAA